MSYSVTIKNAEGTCKSDLFAKMAKRGDLQATKITSLINNVVTIKGYAICNIKSEDKEFDIVYYDTKEFGLISSGSQIFAESVLEYYGDVSKIRIVEVKTRKGKTYKAIPELTENEKQGEYDETTDDLPF